MTVMVPKLTAFFRGSGQPLPPATRLLVDANEMMVHYWWLAALAVAAGYWGWRLFVQRPEGRRKWHAFTWRIPVFSRLVRYRFYAQFARTLGTLLENERRCSGRLSYWKTSPATILCETGWRKSGAPWWKRIVPLLQSAG